MTIEEVEKLLKYMKENTVAKCYICSADFSKTITKYPDGKDPCPDCVLSYRSDPSLEEGDLDTISLDGVESLEDLPLQDALHRQGVFNFPVDDEY